MKNFNLIPKKHFELIKIDIYNNEKIYLYKKILQMIPVSEVQIIIFNNYFMNNNFHKQNIDATENNNYFPFLGKRENLLLLQNSCYYIL